MSYRGWDFPKVLDGRLAIIHSSLLLHLHYISSRWKRVTILTYSRLASGRMLWYKHTHTHTVDAHTEIDKTTKHTEFITLTPNKQHSHKNTHLNAIYTQRLQSERIVGGEKFSDVMWDM